MAVDSSDERLTCAFWNLNRQDRRDLVCRFVRERQVDIVVLAESGTSSDVTLATLRSEVADSFSEPQTVTPNCNSLVVVRDWICAKCTETQVAV